MATATKRRKTNTKASNLIVDLNKTALDTTEEFVAGAIVTGEKWQKLYAKSLKNSEPLIEKNVDIAVDALETLIGQYQYGVKRVKRLFSADTRKVRRAAKKTTEVVTPVAKKVVRATRAKATKTRAAARKAVKSDLTLLPGVGPKMEALLKKNGYKTIDSIAKAKVSEIKAVLAKSERRYTALKPNGWISAAKKLNK